MRNLTNLIGIILVIAGIAILGYRGYTYKTQEKIAQIGDVQITSEQDKTVSIPPVVGGAMVVAGLLLVLIVRIGRK